VHWQASAKDVFQEVVEHTSPAALFHDLAADDGAIGLICPENRGERQMLDTVALAEEDVRRRTLIVVDELTPRNVSLIASGGIADFVTRATPWNEVLSRVQLRLFTSHLRVANGGAHALSGSPADVPSLAQTLTPKEYELYMYFARRFGEPVSRAEILGAVWGRDIGSTGPSNIVDVYVLYVRQKLERIAPHLEIATVRRVGYSLRARRRD
jgi:two-component system alkaline phosphatase synthesis response regulator PhoP